MPTNAELRQIRQWEERLVEDYYDYRCQQLLEPLYQDALLWRSGEISHESFFDAVQRAHLANRARTNFFARSREALAELIQQDPWFADWLTQHPPPPGAGPGADPVTGGDEPGGQETAGPGTGDERDC